MRMQGEKGTVIGEKSMKNEKYKNISAHGHSGIQHHCLSGQVSG